MFSADWLALREPADAAARAVPLARMLASTLPDDRVLQVVDLGAGTGANARALAEHLPPRQRWTLVDRDAALLDTVPARTRSWGAARGYDVGQAGGDLLIRGERVEHQLTRRQLDLRVAVEDATLYDGCDLVTASALLDLVSEQWLQRLAGQCARHGACVLFALTYDGRSACTPAEPEDDEVRELVNRHQQTDKGFGAGAQSSSALSPALGPDAAATAQALFARAGYTVHSEASDWRLDARCNELQRQLIDGWARAALDMAAPAALIERWRARRLAHVEEGRSRITVGHTDLAAWPSPLTPHPYPLPSRGEGAQGEGPGVEGARGRGGPGERGPGERGPGERGPRGEGARGRGRSPTPVALSP